MNDPERLVCPTCGGLGSVVLTFPLFTPCPRCGGEPLSDADAERLRRSREQRDADE